MTQPCQPYDHTPCIAKVLINFINFCSLKLSAIMIFAAVFSCFLTLILSPWDYIISEVSCFLSSPPLHFSFSIPLSQVSFILSLTSFPTRHPSLLISDLYSPFFIYNLGTFMYLPFASPSVYPSPSSLSPIPFPLASLLPPSTSTSLLTSSSLWRMGSVLV